MLRLLVSLVFTGVALMTIRKAVGETTFVPTLKFRVLATDWEAESAIECWTRDHDSAVVIAQALSVRDVSVQIDRVVTNGGA